MLTLYGSCDFLGVPLSIHAEASKPEEIEDFIAESAIMLDFNHPNVLRLVGVCFDTEDKLPVIVLPYMENGDLKHFLKSKRSKSSSTSDEPMPEVAHYMTSSLIINNNLNINFVTTSYNIGSLRSCATWYV